MATTELDTLRIELAREILNTDDLYLLRLMQRTYRRAKSKLNATRIPGIPASLEDMQHVISKFEDDVEKGDAGKVSIEFIAEMEEKYPWLCQYK